MCGFIGNPKDRFCHTEAQIVLGPELQCLLKVKEVLSSVLIFQDVKNSVSN